jgi:hypothetical protein
MKNIRIAKISLILSIVFILSYLLVIQTSAAGYIPQGEETETFTHTPTETFTHTFTPSHTQTNTPSSTFTPTDTYTPTITDTPTITQTPTDTSTPTITSTPTVTVTLAIWKTATYQAAMEYYNGIAADNYPTIIILSVLCGVIILILVVTLIISITKKR